MVALAVYRESPAHPRNCIWSDAGVLDFKLCDRNFDCEHCPLDAALRGVAQQPVPPGAGDRHLPAAPLVFPDDRAYSTTHLWLKPLRVGNVLHVGLDSFGAVLLDTLLEVRHLIDFGPVHAGETFCIVELEAGHLPLATPIAGELTGWNESLRIDPSLLRQDPYEKGWIAEIAGTFSEDEFLQSEQARRQSLFDDRRVCRRLAFELLKTTAPDSDRHVAALGPDVRRVLGAPEYLSLMGDLVH